jgi:DNA/RNA-binding domain of Phe-tRNA-synthetase-like protein
LDADRIEGTPGIRIAQPGESIEGIADQLAEGVLVIADDLGPLARLFGEVGERARVGGQTRRTAIAAIQVGAISQMSVSEALWTASEVMASG